MAGGSVKVRGRPLNEQQMDAISGDDPTRLVLAGAGTGKTTTLIGRVSRLLEEGADPSSILVISLTNNTVADLRRAMREEFGDAFRGSVMTIHSLGHRISGRMPCVGLRRTELLADIMRRRVSEDPSFAADLLAWADDMRSFGNGDLCYSGQSIGNRGLRALGDELFRRRVGFEYSRPDYSQGYVQAHIDIPSVGLRIYADERCVRDSARDQREAISYVSRVFPRSEPMSQHELAAGLLESWGPRIPDSVGAAISRCKCSRRSVADLRSRLEQVPDGSRERMRARLRVLDAVWDDYAMACSEHGFADFEDMVTIAESMLEGGHVPSFSYSHVLIDEYQDVTPILVGLIRALRRVWGFDLFCAGDDWQSIYSFAGGDVWQTYGFEGCWREWGPVSVRRIERTYRCPQQIADMAGRFISKNPSQTRKSIVGVPAPRYPIHLLPVTGDSDIQRMVANRLQLLDPEDTVMVIGRTRSDIYALGGGTGQFEFTTSDPSGTELVTFARLDAETGLWVPVRDAVFMTAHSSKGLEADWVFVIADRERGGGFPSTVADPMDTLFGVRPEGIELAEERRVFYVAMTRARKGLFIVNRTDEDGYALSAAGRFTSEILADNAREFSRSEVICPECGCAMRAVGKPGSMFWGCTGYPECRGTRQMVGRPFRSPSQQLEILNPPMSVHGRILQDHGRGGRGRHGSGRSHPDHLRRRAGRVQAGHLPLPEGGLDGRGGFGQRLSFRARRIRLHRMEYGA